MAVFYTREEVLEQLFNEEEEEEVIDEEGADDEDSEKKSLAEFLKGFNGEEGFQKEFFVEKSVEVLLPIIHQAKQQNSDVAHLSTSMLSVATVFESESRLWLKMIHRRLAGRVSVKVPYYAEVHRNIPANFFHEMKLALKKSESTYFKPPNVHIGENRKGVAIAFTSLYSLVKFLSLLSGLSTGEVRQYFTRVLKGMTRNLHRVKVIISENKDFALYYKYSTGQMNIQFHYGEWNTCGTPKHECQLDNQEG